MNSPWSELPDALAPELRKARPSIAADIIREIRAQVPEFSRPLAGKFGSALQSGVETALTEFADLVEGVPVEQAGGVRVYRALGRAQLAEGRSLDALQTAYRVGARVAWPRYADVARAAGMDTDVIVRLAEAVLVHIEGLTEHSAQGYALARADEAGAFSRRRYQLLELLIGGAPRPVVEQVATAVDWPLPEQVVCVALGPAGVGDPLIDRFEAGAQRGVQEDGPAPLRLAALPVAVLADLEAAEPYLLVPDPALFLREEGQLMRALRGRGAVIGPSVPVDWAGHSLRWARALRTRLRQTGASPREREPVRCDDRLAELLLLADEPLVRLMTERRLAPLQGLTAKQRRRMAETVLAWLQTGRGSAPEVAERLGIHAQTARHRLRQAQQLFGPDLDDPDTRFALEVALRAGLSGRGIAGP